MKRWTKRKRGRTDAILGDYNVIDDLHGFKLKRSECEVRWDGMLVPKWDLDERHPQDFLRSGRASRPVPDARPDEDNFLSGTPTADDL